MITFYKFSSYLVGTEIVPAPPGVNVGLASSVTGLPFSSSLITSAAIVKTVFAGIVFAVIVTFLLFCPFFPLESPFFFPPGFDYSSPIKFELSIKF